MALATRPPRQPWVQAAPGLQRGILTALRTIYDSVDLDALRLACEAGDQPAAVRAAYPLGGAMRAFSEALLAPLTKLMGRVGDGELRALPRLLTKAVAAVDLGHDGPGASLLNLALGNDAATRAARTQIGTMITAIDAKTLEAVRQVVAKAFASGGHPYEQAKQIRQVVGLYPKLGAAVGDYERTLRVQALKLEGKHQGGPKAGQALSERASGRVDRLTESYRQRLLKYRSETIARTETNRASHIGQVAAWNSAISAGLINPRSYVQEWVVTRDNRLDKDICMPMAGQQIPMGGDYLMGDGGSIKYPPAHPRCVAGETQVQSSGRWLGGYRAWFEGEVLDLRFEGQSRLLTVSPNHPIATPTGWKPAGELDEGDYVLGCDFVDSGSSIGPDEENLPAMAAEVFETLRQAGDVVAISVPASPEHFHGDGARMSGEVEIVGADGFLGVQFESEAFDQKGEESFVRRTEIPAPGLDRPRNSGSMAGSLFVAPDRIVGRTGEREALARAALGHSLDHGSGSVPGLDPGRHELLSQPSPTHGKVSGDALGGLPGTVTVKRVAEVNRRYVREHLYDFAALGEVYIANGIIVHNCRCHMVLRTSALPVDLPQFMQATSGSWQSLSVGDRFEWMNSALNDLDVFQLAPDTYQAWMAGESSIGSAYADAFERIAELARSGDWGEIRALPSGEKAAELIAKVPGIPKEEAGDAWSRLSEKGRYDWSNHLPGDLIEKLNPQIMRDYIDGKISAEDFLGRGYNELVRLAKVGDWDKIRALPEGDSLVARLEEELDLKAPAPAERVVVQREGTGHASYDQMPEWMRGSHLEKLMRQLDEDGGLMPIRKAGGQLDYDELRKWSKITGDPNTAALERLKQVEKAGEAVTKELNRRTESALANLVKAEEDIKKAQAEHEKALAAYRKSNAALMRHYNRFMSAAPEKRASMFEKGKEIETESLRLAAEVKAARARELALGDALEIANAKLPLIRANLRLMLREVREVGGNLNVVNGDASANVGVVREAAQWYPKGWVEGDIKVIDVARGYYSTGPIGTLAMSTAIRGQVAGDLRGFSTALHELGHRAEFMVDGLRQAEWVFNYARTTNRVGGRETAKLLNELYPDHGFTSIEKARKDAYSDAYMGKDYGDHAISNHEILSMGIEGLITGSQRLDAQYRNVLLGLLFGL